MEKKNVHNDFKNAGNEKQNSLTSGIRIGLGNFSDTDNSMILQELHTDWKRDDTYTNKLGLIEYHCKVKYLPFAVGNKEDYEKKDLAEIYTPVFHFEFEALNTGKTIYQSHWIMPYSLAWFLKNYPHSSLKEMIRFTARENGFWNRINETDQELRSGTQLSIF